MVKEKHKGLTFLFSLFGSLICLAAFICVIFTFRTQLYILYRVNNGRYVGIEYTIVIYFGLIVIGLPLCIAGHVKANSREQVYNQELSKHLAIMGYIFAFLTLVCGLLCVIMNFIK